MGNEKHPVSAEAVWADLPILRADVARSWRRSLMYGLRPDSALSANCEPIDPETWPLAAARPVLDEAVEDLTGLDVCLMLAGRNGLMLDYWASSRSTETAVDRLGGLLGRTFNEETSGTNAIGTPLEVRDRVVLRAEEHFLEVMKSFDCVGQPLVHPTTRRCDGVLTFATPPGTMNHALTSYFSRIVRDIERRLIDASTATQQRMFAIYQSVRHRHDPVLVLGEDVVLANNAATDLLDSADYSTLRQIAGDTARKSERRLVQLCSGQEITAQVHPVPGGTGTLFEFTSPRPRAPVVRGWRADLPWSQLVRQELEYGRQHRSTLLISGESGTGRTSAINSLAGGKPVAVLDGSRIDRDNEREWLDHARQTLQTRVGLVAVESIHLLPPRVAAQLADQLDLGTAWVAMTGSASADWGDEHIALAARCARRIDLPPLRSRTAELPTIVYRMSKRVRPGVPFRWTAGALQILAANQWPGNLRELQAVVTDITARRSSGDITARDIPQSYQRSPKSRSLTLLERAEHDAIQTALRLSNGNKTHAANRLGISRTTLYKRINQLSVPS